MTGKSTNVSIGKSVTFAILAAAACILDVWADASPKEIVFSRPANENAEYWQSERLPIGNGRLGAMPTGGVRREVVQFNVDSLWTGDKNLTGASDTNESIATDLTVGDYQNFGELVITFDGLDDSIPSDYKRTLDLATAVHTVTFKGVQREMFASAPDDVIAMRFLADEKFSCTLSLTGAHGEKTEQVGPNSWAFSGRLPNGLAYTARADAVFSSEQTEVVVFLRAKTGYDLTRDDFGLGQPCEPYAEAFKGDFEDVMIRHIADYKKYFDRVELEIEGDETTQELVRMFNFGRYLLISSSRPGTLPANLQGIWCATNKPAWHSDYHTNINLQMNYWAVDAANLSEMFEPVVTWLTAANKTAAEETRLAFPDSKGIAYRTSLNAFGGGGWRWNFAGAPWMATMMFDHYLFTRDRKYLVEVAWPAMRDAAEFIFGHLVESPEGELLVRDGWSPEHGPVVDGVAHDQQIVAELFTGAIKAAEAAGDNAFAEKARNILSRLGRDKIGRWGQLQEWREDLDLVGDDHRHTSHLFAVYPGSTITRSGTPRLALAATISLAGRAIAKDSRRSWTWPWRAALWARLGYPERAYDMLVKMLKYNVLPNRFATHPPFQIDGNLGLVAAICEMLVQSHETDEKGNVIVRKLPAIPKAWRHGHVKGLRTRDGGTVDFEW